MIPPRQLTLDLVKPAAPSLENFVVGRNAEVVAALRAVAGGRGERFIYLWGESGAGRSHLLQALDPDSGRNVPRLDSQRSLYVVDDVDLRDDSQQQRLFGLLNDIRADGSKQFIGAGKAAPMHLDLRADVRTRLGWGLVYQVHGLSDAEKAHALSMHATSRGVALSDDVLDYLLTHMPRDMRTLVAIVDALDAYALSVRKAITVPLLRQWTQDSADARAP